MGNRAVVAFEGSAPKTSCMYLHWNGGRASVEAFLNVAKALQLPGDIIGLCTLAEIIRTKFFDGDSVYIDPFGRADIDNGDNGLYRINSEWTIVARAHAPRRGEEVDAEKTAKIAAQILGAVEVASWVIA